MTCNTGAFIDKKDTRDYQIAKFLSPLELPKHYDLTHLMGPVRDQGQFPECVAFAAAAVKESEEIGEGQMSPQFLYNFIGQPGGGAYPRDAMKALVKYGICPENLNTYTPEHVKPNTEEMMLAAKPNKIKSYARLNTLQEMKHCLFQNGTFMISVNITTDWYKTRTDGIVSNGGDPLGYHAMTFVAYNDETQLIKIKNSWGINWGANGYGYISYTLLPTILTDAWSSIDVPESDEEKYVIPVVVKQKTLWIRVWDFVNIFKVRF
jgi:C1A family cysteine protease